MNSTVLLPIIFLLSLSVIIVGVQLAREIRRGARMKLVALLSEHKHMSQKEICNTLYWLEANKLILYKRDFWTAKEIFVAHADLLEKSRALQSTSKDL